MNPRLLLRNAAATATAIAHWPRAPAQAQTPPDAPRDDRAAWVAPRTRVTAPVLENLAANQLKARMPFEAAKGHDTDRRAVTHLEALGRTLRGIAPWLGVIGADGEEEKTRAHFADLTRRALAHALDSAGSSGERPMIRIQVPTDYTNYTVRLREGWR